eukprot:TRINITY_DN859_c0_g2_i4.p1 TRINITY_DN859_c0_g2~~TRINITY_DN859_c0_g2_i4.p1  ORF type:complete len:147 (+),score=9.27 TRINITY_DN859_c0_g2_i4:61-501(+)
MKRHLQHYFLWVDFLKTFDFIVHNYLLDLLAAIQFPPQFLCAVKNLIYQASTNILFNGTISEIKIPVCRSSRQGDPISRYLFNIVLDSLNSLISESLQQSIIHVNGFPILSFMYRDDTVICVDNAVALEKTLSIIDDFAEISRIHV